MYGEFYIFIHWKLLIRHNTIHTYTLTYAHTHTHTIDQHYPVLYVADMIIYTDIIILSLLYMYVNMHIPFNYNYTHAYKHIQPSTIGTYLQMYIHFNSYNFVCLCKVGVYSWEETLRIQ